jgi:hypothetical protein
MKTEDSTPVPDKGDPHIPGNNGTGWKASLGTGSAGGLAVGCAFGFLGHSFITWLIFMLSLSATYAIKPRSRRAVAWVLLIFIGVIVNVVIRELAGPGLPP